jgi:hypothetical protein
VFADPEAESASPRHADEVRAFEAEPIEDRDSVGDAKRHRVGLCVVGPVAAPKTAVVDVDETKLAGWQPPRDCAV